MTTYGDLYAKLTSPEYGGPGHTQDLFGVPAVMSITRSDDGKEHRVPVPLNEIIVDDKRVQELFSKYQTSSDSVESRKRQLPKMTLTHNSALVKKEDEGSFETLEEAGFRFERLDMEKLLTETPMYSNEKFSRWHRYLYIGTDDRIENARIIGISYLEFVNLNTGNIQSTINHDHMRMTAQNAPLLQSTTAFATGPEAGEPPVQQLGDAHPQPLLLPQPQSECGIPQPGHPDATNDDTRLRALSPSTAPADEKTGTANAVVEVEPQAPIDDEVRKKVTKDLIALREEWTIATGKDSEQSFEHRRTYRYTFEEKQFTFTAIHVIKDKLTDKNGDFTESFLKLVEISKRAENEQFTDDDIRKADALLMHQDTESGVNNLRSRNWHERSSLWGSLVENRPQDIEKYYSMDGDEQHKVTPLTRIEFKIEDTPSEKQEWTNIKQEFPRILFPRFKTKHPSDIDQLTSRYAIIKELDKTRKDHGDIKAVIARIECTDDGQYLFLFKTERTSVVGIKMTFSQLGVLFSKDMYDKMKNATIYGPIECKVYTEDFLLPKPTESNGGFQYKIKYVQPSDGKEVFHTLFTKEEIRPYGRLDDNSNGKKRKDATASDDVQGKKRNKTERKEGPCDICGAPRPRDKLRVIRTKLPYITVLFLGEERQSIPVCNSCNARYRGTFKVGKWQGTGPQNLLAITEEERKRLPPSTESEAYREYLKKLQPPLNKRDPERHRQDLVKILVLGEERVKCLPRA